MRNELSIVSCPLSIVNYKNMEVPINDFDDIRPLNNDEVKDAIEPLVIMSGKMSSMNNTYLSKHLSLQEAMVLLPSTSDIRIMEK
mgnify:CR=1 FL=1